MASAGRIPIIGAILAVFGGMVRRVDLSHVLVNRGKEKPLQQVQRSFQAVLRTVGITDFRFHDLRHTSESHLAMAGVELITIKELMGHKDITMMLRYAHLAPAAEPAKKKKAVNVLGGFWGENGPTRQKLDNRSARIVVTA
jgi:integrase